MSLARTGPQAGPQARPPARPGQALSHEGKKASKTRIDALSKRIRSIEGRAALDRVALDRARQHERSDVVPTGWPQVDSGVLSRMAREGPDRGGLGRGALHEWLGVGDPEGGFTRAGRRTPQAPWSPPQALLTHLAERSLLGELGYVLWIGRQVWPYPRTLVRGGDRTLLERSLFVDPPDRARRLWAIDAALRSAAVCTVVADGSQLRMDESRRLQLAAESGRALVLLARPLEESGELSVAATRWAVLRQTSANGRPSWRVALLRSKGSNSQGGSNVTAMVADPAFGNRNLLGRWILEWNREKSVVAELPPLVDGDGVVDGRDGFLLAARAGPPPMPELRRKA